MSSSPDNRIKSIKLTTASTIVQHTCRGSAWHLGKHAVHMGSRTILKWYTRAPRDKHEHDQHSSSPDACTRCTKKQDNPVPCLGDSNKRFNSVSMKSLTFHSIKSVIFTKLELSTSQKGAKIVCRIDTGCDGNLMAFRVFRMLFLRSTMAELMQK